MVHKSWDRSQSQQRPLSVSGLLHHTLDVWQSDSPQSWESRQSCHCYAGHSKKIWGKLSIPTFWFFWPRTISHLTPTFLVNLMQIDPGISEIMINYPRKSALLGYLSLARYRLLGFDNFISGVQFWIVTRYVTASRSSDDWWWSWRLKAHRSTAWAERKKEPQSIPPASFNWLEREGGRGERARRLAYMTSGLEGENADNAREVMSI